MSKKRTYGMDRPSRPAEVAAERADPPVEIKCFTPTPPPSSAMGVTDIDSLTLILRHAPPGQAIGAAAAYLIEAVDRNPGQMQRVLTSQISRVTGSGRVQAVSIIDILISVARGNPI